VCTNTRPPRFRVYPCASFCRFVNPLSFATVCLPVGARVRLLPCVIGRRRRCPVRFVTDSLKRRPGAIRSLLGTKGIVSNDAISEQPFLLLTSGAPALEVTNDPFQYLLLWQKCETVAGRSGGAYSPPPRDRSACPRPPHLSKKMTTPPLPGIFLEVATFSLLESLYYTKEKTLNHT